jgi:hypothetical protein
MRGARAERAWQLMESAKWLESRSALLAAEEMLFAGGWMMPLWCAALPAVSRYLVRAPAAVDG